MAQRIVGTTGTLQMPQGGLDHNEKEEDGIMREIYEEIGTTNVSIISKASKQYSYKFPAKAQHRIYNGKYIGQKQTWFLLYFHGDDSEIDLCKTRKQEFVAWKWVDINHVHSLTIKFKEEMYQMIMSEFKETILDYQHSIVN